MERRHPLRKKLYNSKFTINNLKQQLIISKGKRKVNWKKVLTVGLKVIATAGAAFAVWMGFSKAIEGNNPTQPQRGGKHHGESTHPGGEGCKEVQRQKGEQVVTNLRKFQDTCGKLFSVAQSLATVGENLYRIFHGGPDFGYFPGASGCGGRMGGFTRVSSNVIEANWTPGPSSPWGQQNKYCF